MRHLFSPFRSCGVQWTVEPAYLEAKYDLVILDPEFTTTVKISDPETGGSTSHRVGGSSPSIYSFKPPHRRVPVEIVNPLLVALGLHRKFLGFELYGVALPPHCLPYKERIMRLVDALFFEPRLPTPSEHSEDDTGPGEYGRDGMGPGEYGRDDMGPGEYSGDGMGPGEYSRHDLRTSDEISWPTSSTQSDHLNVFSGGTVWRTALGAVGKLLRVGSRWIWRE